MSSPSLALLNACLITDRTELGELIGHLTKSLSEWAPRPGMRTVEGPLIEIAATEVQTLSRLKFNIPIPLDAVGERFNPAKVLGTLRVDTSTYISQLGEAWLTQLSPPIVQQPRLISET